MVSTDTDPYGRALGHIHLADGKDVNLMMVANGHAWVYRRYIGEGDLSPAGQDVFIATESHAKQAGKGLWGRGGTPVEPWKFRQSN